MTKLRYIGKQEVPSYIEKVGFRLWDIVSTDDPRVLPYLHSTVSIQSLQNLGIVSVLIEAYEKSLGGC